MSNLNLYSIEQEFVQLAERIIEAGGEVDEQIETALAINKENLEVKSAKYCYVVKDWQNDIKNIDAEIERLTSLKNNREKAIENLKDKVKNAMLLYGIKSIKSQNISLNLTPSKAVIIEDADEIPAKYIKKTTKVTETISKTDIKKDLEAGLEVAGARLQENNNLQIK